jgi:hypothetical protein
MSENNSSSKLDLTRETHLLNFYMTVIVGNFGIVFNGVNIVVSLRKAIQKIKVMGHFNVCISCSNILLLTFITYLLLFPPSIGYPDLASSSIFGCMFLQYFLRVFATISNWLYVLLTYDRINLFSDNYENSFLNRKRNVRLVIGLVSFVIFVLHGANLFFYPETRIINSKNVTICSSSNTIMMIRDYMGLLIRIVLPLVLQTVFNVMLIKKLFKFRTHLHSSLKQEKRFAFTVVISNVVFFIGEIPFLVTTVLINMYGYNQTYISTSSRESAISSFAYLCSNAFALFTSYSLLFFVNFLTNKKYKQEVRKLLRRMGPCSVRGQSSTNNDCPRTIVSPLTM